MYAAPDTRLARMLGVFTSIYTASLWDGEELRSHEVPLRVTLVGLLSEHDELHCLSDHGVQYFGALSEGGDGLSGRFNGYTALGHTFADGSATSVAQLGSRTSAGQYLGRLQVQTAAGTSSESRVQLTLGMSDVTGNDGQSAAAPAAASRCLLAGAVREVDATRNAYTFDCRFSDCAGDYLPLAGQTVRAQATFSVTTVHDMAGAHDPAQAQRQAISVLATFERS
jgi:hypothetical protein